MAYDRSLVRGIAAPSFIGIRNSRWARAEQFVKAITSTVEHKFLYKWTNTDEPGGDRSHAGTTSVVTGIPVEL